MTYIYTLHAPNGEVKYVGKTNLSTKKRYYQHVYSALTVKTNTYVSKWIRSLNACGQKPSIQVVQDVRDDKWVEAEQFWIKFFIERGCELTNLTIGGEGLTGWHHSASARQKMKISHAARSRTKYIENGIVKRKLNPVDVCYKDKGSSARNVGKNNPQAKLTEELVTEIKSLLLGKQLSQSEIAGRFGISRECVSLIQRNKRWAQVPWPDAGTHYALLSDDEDDLGSIL